MKSDCVRPQPPPPPPFTFATIRCLCCADINQSAQDPFSPPLAESPKNPNPLTHIDTLTLNPFQPRRAHVRDTLHPQITRRLVHTDTETHIHKHAHSHCGTYATTWRTARAECDAHTCKHRVIFLRRHLCLPLRTRSRSRALAGSLTNVVSTRAPFGRISSVCMNLWVFSCTIVRSSI